MSVKPFFDLDKMFIFRRHTTHVQLGIKQKVKLANSNFCKVQNNELKMFGAPATMDSMLNQCLAFSRDMAKRKLFFNLKGKGTLFEKPTFSTVSWPN